MLINLFSNAYFHHFYGNKYSRLICHNEHRLVVDDKTFSIQTLFVVMWDLVGDEGVRRGR